MSQWCLSTNKHTEVAAAKTLQRGSSPLPSTCKLCRASQLAWYCLQNLVRQIEQPLQATWPGCSRHTGPVCSCTYSCLAVYLSLHQYHRRFLLDQKSLICYHLSEVPRERMLGAPCGLAICVPSFGDFWLIQMCIVVSEGTERC